MSGDDPAHADWWISSGLPTELSYVISEYSAEHVNLRRGCYDSESFTDEQIQQALKLNDAAWSAQLRVWMLTLTDSATQSF
jgi:hypothetical protein